MSKCRSAYMVYIMNDDKEIILRQRVVGKWVVRIWQEFAAVNGYRCEYVKE